MNAATGRSHRHHDCRGRRHCAVARTSLPRARHSVAHHARRHKRRSAKQNEEQNNPTQTFPIFPPHFSFELFCFGTIDKRRLLQAVGRIDELFDLLATRQHFVDVLHHDAFDVGNLLLHSRNFVRLWIVRVVLHALFQYARKRARIFVGAIRAVEACRNVVEKRVRNAVRERHISHAQKDHRVVYNVVKVLRLESVGLARVGGR